MLSLTIMSPVNSSLANGQLWLLCFACIVILSTEVCSLHSFLHLLHNMLRVPVCGQFGHVICTIDQCTLDNAAQFFRSSSFQHILHILCICYEAVTSVHIVWWDPDMQGYVCYLGNVRLSNAALGGHNKWCNCGHQAVPSIEGSTIPWGVSMGVASGWDECACNPI